MMNHTENRQRRSGKRKRIPSDPRFQRRNPNAQENMTLSGNLFQKRQDADTISENRLNTSGEEDLK